MSDIRDLLPTNPTDGQEETVLNVTYKFNDSTGTWDIVPAELDVDQDFDVNSQNALANSRITTWKNKIESQINEQSEQLPSGSAWKTPPTITYTDEGIPEGKVGGAVITESVLDVNVGDAESDDITFPAITLFFDEIADSNSSTRRFDLIVADTDSGAFIVMKGQEGFNPGIPEHNSETQIVLATRLVTKEGLQLSLTEAFAQIDRLKGELSDLAAKVDSPVAEFNTRTASWTITAEGNEKHSDIYTGAANATVTIPNSEEFPVGYIRTVYQEGAGLVTVDSGSEINLKGLPTTQGRYFAIQLWKIAVNEWRVIAGGIEPFEPEPEQ